MSELNIRKIRRSAKKISFVFLETDDEAEADDGKLVQLAGS